MAKANKFVRREKMIKILQAVKKDDKNLPSFLGFLGFFGLYIGCLGV